VFEGGTCRLCHAISEWQKTKKFWPSSQDLCVQLQGTEHFLVPALPVPSKAFSFTAWVMPSLYTAHEKHGIIDTGR
jgi:hypothetical protein